MEISLSCTNLPVSLNRSFANFSFSNSCEQTPLHTEHLPHAQTHASPDPSQRARWRMSTSHTTLFIHYSDISSTIASYHIHYSPILFCLLRNFITSIIFSPLSFMLKRISFQKRPAKRHLLRRNSWVSFSLWNLISWFFHRYRYYLLSKSEGVWSRSDEFSHRYATSTSFYSSTNLGTRNIFCYFFLRSDNFLTHQTTKNLKMVHTRNSNLGIEQMSRFMAFLRRNPF